MGLRYILQLESRQLVGSKDDSCLGGWGAIDETGRNKDWEPHVPFGHVLKCGLEWKQP